MRVISTHPSDHRHTNALEEALKDIAAPGWAVVFGDRRDMLDAALHLHYNGVKLVHVGGGDTPHGTDGHPDHRTRDAISMLARVHCVTNHYAHYNLRCLGVVSGVYVTGSPGLDEVVRYAATLDPNRSRNRGVLEWFPEKHPELRLSLNAFLEQLAWSSLFVSDSSSALYEAPILGTPVRLVGDRQAGRRGPYHHPEGKACELIAEILRRVCT